MQPPVTQPGIPPTKPWWRPSTRVRPPSPAPGSWPGVPPGAVAAIDEWLALLDNHHYGEGWDRAHERLKAGGTRERFEEQIREIRRRAGPVSSRKDAGRDVLANGRVVVRYQLGSDPAGYPAGYSETIGALTDSDGAWRVDSYEVSLHTQPGMVLSLDWSKPWPTYPAGVIIEVKRVAEEWLTLVDGQRFGEAWDRSHRHLKDAGPSESFEVSVRDLRMTLAPQLSRQFWGVGGHQGAGGAILLNYRNASEQETRAYESVGVAQEPDGAWRVASYFIQSISPNMLKGYPW
jgi:hypothetical protein